MRSHIKGVLAARSIIASWYHYVATVVVHVDADVSPRRRSTTASANLDTSDATTVPGARLAVVHITEYRPVTALLIRDGMICTVPMARDSLLQPPFDKFNTSQNSILHLGRRLLAEIIGARGFSCVILTDQMHGNEETDKDDFIRLL